MLPHNDCSASGRPPASRRRVVTGFECVSCGRFAADWDDIRHADTCTDPHAYTFVSRTYRGRRGRGHGRGAQ